MERNKELKVYVTDRIGEGVKDETGKKGDIRKGKRKCRIGGRSTGKGTREGKVDRKKEGREIKVTQGKEYEERGVVLWKRNKERKGYIREKERRRGTVCVEEEGNSMCRRGGE